MESILIERDSATALFSAVLKYGDAGIFLSSTAITKVGGKWKTTITIKAH